MEVTEKIEKGRDMFPEFHLPHPILRNAIDAMESCVDAIQEKALWFSLQIDYHVPIYANPILTTFYSPHIPINFFRFYHSPVHSGHFTEAI